MSPPHEVLARKLVGSSRILEVVKGSGSCNKLADLVLNLFKEMELGQVRI